MDTADKIKYIRTHILKLSQEKFAKKIDVTRTTIKNWEEGLSLPTTTHITMISLASNVTTDYLIKDDCDLELSVHGLNNEEYKLLLNVVKYFNKINSEESE